MDVRMRMTAIRLAEKIDGRPGYASKIGVSLAGLPGRDGGSPDWSWEPRKARRTPRQGQPLRADQGSGGLPRKEAQLTMNEVN